MKILNIKIKNLNSLKLETEIDFEKQPFREVGLFAIVGDTGAGKTTILDAITLGLYGKVHRNKEVKEVISYGAGDCYAEVIFEVDKNRYLAQWAIWRARGKMDGNILGPNRKLSIWNKEEKGFKGIAEKVREVDEKVEEITGLDYNRFTRSMMLSQGDFAAFLKAGEKERSDLLERITGTEIYSELSKSAYSRFKIEEGKLHDLKQELARLQLLDREEVQELKVNLKDKEAIGKAQKTALNQKRTAILWWKDLEKVIQSLEKNKANLLKIEENKDLFKSDLTKLEGHKKTVPFQAKLSKYDDKVLEYKALEKGIVRLNNFKKQYGEREIIKKVTYQEKELAFKKLKGEQKEFLQLIEEIIKLDVGIGEKIVPLKKKQGDLKTIKERLEQSKKKLRDLKQNQQSVSAQFLAAKNWTTENENLKKLPEEYETIKHLFFEIGGISKEKKTLKIGIVELEKELAGFQKKESEFTKAIKRKEENLNKLNELFKSKLPENYALGRSELLGNLNREIEKMSEIWKRLEDWKRHQEAYQQLMKELKNYTEQLENLQNQVSVLDRELMSSLDVRDEAKRQLEFKKEIWEQQLAIANYEKDRTKLEVGDTCPLCLSTEHPFREKDFKPFVDESKSEYDSAKSYYDKLEKEFRKLLNQQQELNVKIGELRGNELEQVNGRLKRQEVQVTEIESQFSDLMKILNEQELIGSPLGAFRSDKLAKKLEHFSTEMIQKKQLRDELLKLNLDLEKAEKSLNKQKEEWQKIEIVIKQKLEEQKYKVQKSKELEEGFLRNKSSLSDLLTQYGMAFEVEKGNEIFKELAEKKQQISNNAAIILKLEKQLNVLEKELELEQSKIVEYNDRNQILGTEVENELMKVEEFRTERGARFGKKDPEKEREIFNKNLEKQEQELFKLKVDFDDLILKIKTTKHALKDKEEQELKIKQVISELKIDLEVLLPNSGFENLEAVKDSILNMEIANKIEKRREQLATKTQILESEKNDLEMKLIKKEAEKSEMESLQILQESLPVLEEEFQNLQQGIGKIKGQLSENQERKKASKDLIESIDKQRVETNRWQALSHLIGSADGQKFRKFAQGLTLKNLVILANRYLENLNGRYVILKPDDQDLNLDIMDTFQADNTRSMNTLSGGESFLISLALALGLSDLAGKNTNIRSLFIDEGFGTLDDNSLDMALTTLENLQASGKTIGVISHVKALKERITTQIFIQKKGSGFSEIEVMA